MLTMLFLQKFYLNNSYFSQQPYEIVTIISNLQMEN